MLVQIKLTKVQCFHESSGQANQNNIYTHISLVYHTENTSHAYFEVNLNNGVQGNYHSFFWEPTKN